MELVEKHTKLSERKRLTFRSLLDKFSPVEDEVLSIRPLFMDKSLENKPDKNAKNTQIFDFIVLIGMVLNLLLAVFLILYYFDLL